MKKVLFVLCSSIFAFVGCDLFTGPAGPAGPSGPAGSDLRSTPLLFVPATNLAEALAYSNSTIVTTGYYGSIFTSTDGVSWTDESIDSGTLSWVAYGGGRFVAASDSQIFVSTDEGESWAETLDYGSFNAQNGNLITGLASGAGSFVAVGLTSFASNFGFIMRSDNGESWTDVTPSTTPNQFTSVSYANGQFIAATNTGYLYRSSDGGLTWSGPDVIPQYSDTVRKIAYGNGRYLILGQHSILTSTDFSSFNTLYDGNVSFTSIAFNGSLFVILCSDSNNFWSLWYTDGTVFYWPSGLLPPPENGYTDIQWVPWLNGGTHVISQMQAL
uniref:DUF6242 domain-containing protein n=1 Tax=Gracilinema caldarium TaxID=215591 RepID=A0A7C3E6Y8_9SPIR